MKPQSSPRLVAEVTASSQDLRVVVTTGIEIAARGAWRELCDRTVTLGQEKMPGYRITDRQAKEYLPLSHSLPTLYIPCGCLLT